MEEELSISVTTCPFFAAAGIWCVDIANDVSFDWLGRVVL